MVPHFVTQLGNLKNQELSYDRKCAKIGNFSPFIVAEFLFKCKKQILRQKIHKNMWVKLFMTTFRSCLSPGCYPAISHFRGPSPKTSYLSHTEITNFCSGSGLEPEISVRVGLGPEISARVRNFRLPHGFSRMSEVGRWWHFEAPKIWRKNRGETIQRPILMYFCTRNLIFALRKPVR